MGGDDLLLRLRAEAEADEGDGFRHVRAIARQPERRAADGGAGRRARGTGKGREGEAAAHVRLAVSGIAVDAGRIGDVVAFDHRLVQLDRVPGEARGRCDVQKPHVLRQRRDERIAVDGERGGGIGGPRPAGIGHEGGDRQPGMRLAREAEVQASGLEAGAEGSVVPACRHGLAGHQVGRISACWVAASMGAP